MVAGGREPGLPVPGWAAQEEMVAAGWVGRRRGIRLCLWGLAVFLIGMATKRCELCVLSRPKSNPEKPIPALYNPLIFSDGYLVFFLLDLGLEECCEQCMPDSFPMK